VQWLGPYLLGRSNLRAVPLLQAIRQTGRLSGTLGISTLSIHVPPRRRRAAQLFAARDGVAHGVDGVFGFWSVLHARSLYSCRRISLHHFLLRVLCSESRPLKYRNGRWSGHPLASSSVAKLDRVAQFSRAARTRLGADQRRV